MKNSFDDIKTRVLELIKNNWDKEVTRKTNYRTAGIYMLYVDCFTDEKIIPFYIGQTDNFQERHKKHLSDLLALNRLEQSCYEYALLRHLYHGRYRPCKIFSYMVNHKCHLNDFHMIILEEIEDSELRLERETEYINILCAPFFGFNQLNCVSKKMDLLAGKYSEAEYRNLVNDDYNNLLQYYQFGYSTFNWYLMHGNLCKEQIDYFLSTVASLNYTSVVQKTKRIKEIEGEQNEIKNYNRFQAEKDSWESCRETIKAYFKQHGLRSEEKQKLIITAYLFEFKSDLKELNTYFQRHKERITTHIFDLLNEKHSNLLASTKAKIRQNQEKYQNLDNEKAVLLQEMYTLLLSSRQYHSHPLESLYDGCFSFLRKPKEENICYINIEYTCFQSKFEFNIYPEICKIDYLVIRNGEEHEKSVFIKNSLMDFFERDDVYYLESGFRAGPFTPSIEGNPGTYISVAMEYRNGINEHTLHGIQGEDALKILKEIDSLIDDKTQIIYSTSGYKSTVKSITEIIAYQNIQVLKRIEKQCR